MRFLLIETNKESELNVDVRMPYILGILKEDRHATFYIRTDDFDHIRDEIGRFDMDYIITSEMALPNSRDGTRYILSSDFQRFYSALSKRRLDLFQYTPIFHCDIERLGHSRRYIPHLVLSNPCNYRRKIPTNPLYKGIRIPRGVRNSGCSFCKDLHSNRTWNIQSRDILRRQLSSARDYLAEQGLKSLRIIGETYISKLDQVIEDFEALRIKDVDIVITMRPELIIQRYGHFVEALSLAQKSNLRIVFCSIGIESFYPNDLLLYNRCLNTERILESVYLVYNLKKRFEETLIIDRYNLFNFILFNPYTSVDSIEFNLRTMKFIGIENIHRGIFLNRLQIDRNTPIHYKIGKDGLLTGDCTWRFMDKRIEKYYSRIQNIKEGWFAIDSLYRHLEAV